MKAEIKEKMEEYISRQLNDIQNLAVGSSSHKTAIEDIGTTVSAIQAIEKDEREALAAEREFKRDTIIKSLEAGVTVGTLGLSVASLLSREKWLKAGFELEQTGTFTVQTLKLLFNSLFKK